MKEAVRRWFCEDCWNICTDDEMLSAPHPFTEGEVYGCPTCREANTLVGACSSQECKKASSSGQPSIEGFRYLFLCWDHSPSNPNAKPIEALEKKTQGLP